MPYDNRSQMVKEFPPDASTVGRLHLGTQQPCCEKVNQPHAKTTGKYLATASDACTVPVN